MGRAFLGALAAVVVLSADVAAAFPVNSGSGRNFADADGDGICDNVGNMRIYAGVNVNGVCDGCGRNFVDENGDGVCDNYVFGQGQGGGCGRGARSGCGNGFRGGHCR